MMTLLLLYFTVSLLASLLIYGACLAAARADQVIGDHKAKLDRKKQPRPSARVEQPQE